MCGAEIYSSSFSPRRHTRLAICRTSRRRTGLCRCNGGSQCRGSRQPIRCGIAAGVDSIPGVIRTRTGPASSMDIAHAPRPDPPRAESTCAATPLSTRGACLPADDPTTNFRSCDPSHAFAPSIAMPLRCSRTAAVRPHPSRRTTPAHQEDHHGKAGQLRSRAPD